MRKTLFDACPFQIRLIFLRNHAAPIRNSSELLLFHLCLLNASQDQNRRRRKTVTPDSWIYEFQPFCQVISSSIHS